MTALDQAVPKLLRFLTPSMESRVFPLRTFYTSSVATDSDSTEGIFHERLDARSYVNGTCGAKRPIDLSGYLTLGWGGIANRFDARRKVTDDLLFKAILENEILRSLFFFFSVGPPGPERPSL